MDRQRQRKLEARERRQASLTARYGGPVSSFPVPTDMQVKIEKRVEPKIEIGATNLEEERRGPGRPKVIQGVNKKLTGKKRSKIR